MLKDLTGEDLVGVSEPDEQVLGVHVSVLVANLLQLVHALRQLLSQYVELLQNLVRVLDQVVLLADYCCLLRNVPIKYANMTEELLALVTIVVDDLVRMRLAVEALLLQHLLLLAGLVRPLDYLYVLVNLITYHHLILVAQLALELLLILPLFVSDPLDPAIIADDVAAVKHNREALIIINNLLALIARLRRINLVHLFYFDFY